MLSIHRGYVRNAARVVNFKSFSSCTSSLSRRAYKPPHGEDRHSQAGDSTPGSITKALRKHIPHYGVPDDELSWRQLKSRADEVRRLHEVREDFARSAKQKRVACSDEALEEMVDMYMEENDRSAEEERKKRPNRDARMRALREEFAMTAKAKGLECSDEELDEMVQKFMQVDKLYRAALIMGVGGVIFLLWRWLSPSSNTKSKAGDKDIAGG